VRRTALPSNPYMRVILAAEKAEMRQVGAKAGR
jgi:hypothetical protein